MSKIQNKAIEELNKKPQIKIESSDLYEVIKIYDVHAIITRGEDEIEVACSIKFYYNDAMMIQEEDMVHVSQHLSSEEIEEIIELTKEFNC